MATRRWTPPWTDFAIRPGLFALGPTATVVACRITSPRSTLRTAQIRSNVSSVGFRSSRSTKLIIARDNPARAASSVMDIPRLSRVSWRSLATFEQTASRSLDSDILPHYPKFCLTRDVTIVTFEPYIYSTPRSRHPPRWHPLCRRMPLPRHPRNGVRGLCRHRRGHHR